MIICRHIMNKKKGLQQMHQMFPFFHHHLLLEDGGIALAKYFMLTIFALAQRVFTTHTSCAPSGIAASASLSAPSAEALSRGQISYSRSRLH